MAESLKTSPELAGFTVDEWQALMGHAAPFAALRGETLFRQGDPPSALYLVGEGLLEIETRLPGDEAAVISRIEPGQMVGEFALLDDGPRSANVRAVDASAGFVIARDRFRALLSDGSPWALRLGTALRRLVAARTRATLERIVAEGLFDPLGLRRIASGPRLSGMPGTDVSELLAGLPRLAGCEGMAEAGQLELAPAGSTIAAPNEPQDGLRVVLRGAVRAAIPRGAMQEQIFVFGPGCFVGLTGYSDGGGQPLLVSAAEEALVLHLRGDDLVRAAETAATWYPPLLLAMGRQLVQDQRKANRHLGRSLALLRFNHAGEPA